MVFVYHVILQDDMIEMLNDFMVWSPSRFVSGDIIFVVCHVIPQHHMMKESCDFMGKVTLTYNLLAEVSK